MKTKTMNRDIVELLIQRISGNEPSRQDIRLKNMFYVNGEYDWIMRFTAPDHATARKYYETIRLLYSDHLQERPILMDINMPGLNGFEVLERLKENPSSKPIPVVMLTVSDQDEDIVKSYMSWTLS